MNLPPSLGIGLVLAALGALMLAVRAGQKRFAWSPELSRKSVHMGMGAICLTFPWLFHSRWPVWLLAGMAGLALGAVRSLPALKQRFGSVLGGVERASWGELLFPVSVAFVFTLAWRDPLRYCVPVLILTLADALAALIGRRYGQMRYETDDGYKSAEGSTVFFFFAFLATHIPLLLMSNTGRLESLLIATVMGLILMLMEAIAWRGLDNLFVPLVSYVCLTRMLTLSAGELAHRLIVLLAVLGALLLWRRSTRLTQSAVIGAALVAYVAWAVGGWHWLLAPAMTAIAYTVVCRQPVGEPQRHTVHAIACVGGLGVFWLSLSLVIGTVNTIYPYGVGYGANLGMILLAYFADSRRNLSLALGVMLASLLGFAALAAPYLFVWRENANVLRLAAVALPLLLITVSAFAWWQPAVRSCPTDSARWLRQAALSALASAAAFGVISFFEPWSTSF